MNHSKSNSSKYFPAHPGVYGEQQGEQQKLYPTAKKFSKHHDEDSNNKSNNNDVGEKITKLVVPQNNDCCV